MTIMFPLVLVPSYNASNGDPVIFYGVTAGILAGAVAGDHASPISDTTILSAMASECQILQHVKTQAPYAIVVAIWSILVGTIPSGRATFANWVSILLGFMMMVLHVVLFSEFTINKTGRYDILTEIYLRCVRDKDFLLKLKADTVVAYATGQPVELEETQKIIDEEGGDTFSVKDQQSMVVDAAEKLDEKEFPDILPSSASQEDNAVVLGANPRVGKNEDENSAFPDVLRANSVDEQNKVEGVDTVDELHQKEDIALTEEVDQLIPGSPQERSYKGGMDMSLEVESAKDVV